MASAYDINAWDEPKPERQGMSDEEIVSILREQERAAVSFRDTILAGEQSAAIDFYEAEPFGDEEDGRSQVVVPDVAEVVDYTQISILRTVASADRVVEFEPGDTDQIPEMPDEPEEPDIPPPPQAQLGQQPDPAAMEAYQQQFGPQIEEYQQAKADYQKAVKQMRRWEKQRDKAADDATQTVNHMFMRRQNGYRVLVDWIQSGLIEKIGVVKTACVTERKKIKESGVVSAEQLAMAHQQGMSFADIADNGDGSYTVTTQAYKEVKRYLDYPIPSEEFIFPPRTRDEDTADYLAHRCRKPLSDLIEMGFDRETVEGLPSDEGDLIDDQRTWSRWEDENFDLGAEKRAPSMREVMLLEEYVRLDLDDDGVAELWQIFRVGDTILGMEEVDEAPFVVWTPFPRAHRLVGNSTAEKVMDIQRVDSVLLRQALDGTYLTNKPRLWLDEASVGDTTIDDLLSPYPGTIVRGRGVKPEPISDAFDITKSLGMLEYMTAMRETRTGITRLNQGLDEDTLNKTASGQAALQAKGEQMEEYVARNFAEAMARLFAKKLRLMAVHGEPIAIKVAGNYRRVDPTTWDTDMNVVVRVGLGSGKKELRLSYRQQLAENQEAGLQIGITDPKRVFNNAAAMIRDAGLGNPDDYWLDPDSDEFKEAQANKPPTPDPAVMKVQADAAAAQQQAQADQQASQQKIQLSQQESAAKLDIAHQQGQQQIALAGQKAALEQQLARDKADFEAGLARQTADRNYELAVLQETNRHALALQSQQHAHEVNMQKAKAVPQTRPGGDLSK